MTRMSSLGSAVRRCSITTSAVTTFGLATGGPLDDDDAAIAALLSHVATEPAMTTTSRRAPPQAEASTPEQLAASILALLSSIERYDPGAPAAVAFRAALRRKGQDLAEAGGPAALADMLARVRADALDRADAREAVLTAAWADLSGWRS